MVSDLNTSTNKGCKVDVQKKLFFGQILPYWAGFFWYWCFLLRLTVLKTPLPKIFKLFRFSESWGKSNGKKWSQILKKIAHNGCEIAAPIFLFFGEFCLTGRFFLVLVLLSAWVERCFVSGMRDFFLLFLFLAP